MQYLTWIIDEVYNHSQRDRVFDAVKMHIAMNLEDNRLHESSGILRYSSKHRESNAYTVANLGSQLLAEEKRRCSRRRSSGLNILSTGGSLHAISGNSTISSNLKPNYRKSLSADAAISPHDLEISLAAGTEKVAFENVRSTNEISWASMESPTPRSALSEARLGSRDVNCDGLESGGGGGDGSGRERPVRCCGFWICA